ncbi:MAG: hypothetical protein CVU56_00560 [Deltaproteobacteria bacterium HGW-Deltaproteobacteria-14]|jgi:hypothetical protein|nr:MAG: hypothetical protein CVU56_00560 [Deltaproteobacteria bacterium HGW-Deltaproteobacteria-14]
MTSLHDAWTSLRHGGNLLSPTALDALPAPEKAPWGLADRLRTALVALDPDKPAPDALGAALDVVLDDACGLHDGWRKGSALGASEAAKLLDGTALKPRRLWTGPAGEALAVFTTNASRIGVGKGRRPVAQVVEYLRRRTVSLGVLTNGSQWRLIWADTDSLAWAEWDADRWLDADQLSDEFAVLRRVLSPVALSGAGDEYSPLLLAIRDTRRGQAKLSKELGERVRRAVETLLRARQPVVGPAWDDHARTDLYGAACHFVMRFVVTLFAEARELLPADNPVYHQAYGLRGLLDQLDRLTPERRRARHMAWPRLLALFRLLHQGSPHPAVTIPAYGGDLFRPGDPEGDGVQRALALLEALAAPPDDDVIHRVLVLLTRTTLKVRDGAGWRTVAAPVDFTELTSEYIGILYEGLLDYELHRAGSDPVVFLNLGDQPALPLDRLEAMEDKALLALVEKAKIKKQAATEDADADEEADEEGDDDAPDDVDPDDDAEGDDASDGVAPDADESDSVEDARAEARARALAWGRRAAEVGKLVKKPKGKKADVTAVFEATLDAAAKQLVADLKLPGELYLVRWGGTRKGAGTFYTRPQLTLPTVRRTLEPLIYDAGVVHPPETLLALKVCDPAMGSGSFLVAALRVLTAAVVTSLHTHDRITRVNGRTTVACDLLPEGDRSQPTEGFDDRLEAIVRRAVVEHCLYGVDIDPLAVELARVALWVETLDKRLPFTFLDHKLRCGDSLVGTWLDRFRDYPLLAFDRKSPDEKYKGVHHQADVWHKALKAKRAEAIGEQVDLLTGQLRLEAKATSDDELKAAVERVRRLYRELRAVPAGRPDERARIWRERIQADPALARVREAFDTWCALWFWPADQLDALPLPRDLHAPSALARAVVKTLREEKRFLHWELEFPDVFTEEGAGFDAVVGNPPWETQKPLSQEFFTNLDPLYRTYGKQDALRAQLTIFELDPVIERQWLAYNGDFKDRGNFVRYAAEPYGDGKVAGHAGGDLSLVRGARGAELHRTWRGKRSRFRGTSDPAHPFQHQGSADLNTYKMFVEVAHALLRVGGHLGIVVPNGLYSDKGASELRRLLLDACDWRVLYVFQNERKFFHDVHHSQKQCVVIARKGGSTTFLPTAFKLGPSESPEAEDIPSQLETNWRPLHLGRDLVERLNPGTHGILELISDRDLRILERTYDNSVLLGDDGANGWGIKYAREFDMTNDSRLFTARDRAESNGFKADAYGRWLNNLGEVMLPLYEGRMIGQFDFSEKGWVSGRGRTAIWRTIPWPEKRWEPSYLVRSATYQPPFPTKLHVMDVTSSINTRTAIGAMIPAFPAGHKAPLLHCASRPGVFASVFNSLAYDWVLRMRLSSLSLTLHVLNGTPLPITVSPSVCALIEALSTRIGCGHAVFAPRWVEHGLRRHAWRRLWAITPHERLRLRCMLDGTVATLYGLDRDDFAWILKDCDHPAAHTTNKGFCRQLDPKGFWRVDKAADPELRHTVLSLAAFDDLQAGIAAAGGDRDAGIQAFCDQHDGDGWMLPETLCLADLGLTRTVDVGLYDERARTPQPVRSRLGERFLDWQLAQTLEESWAECERHAKAILEGAPQPAIQTPSSAAAAPKQQQLGLFGSGSAD